MGKAVAAECDVAKYDELAKACGGLQNSLSGSIDTIINNAGIPRSMRVALTGCGRWLLTNGKEC